MASLELPVTHSEYPFFILPAGEEGLVIYRQKFEDLSEDFHHYEIYFYNQHLRNVGSALVKVGSMFEVIQHTYSNKNIFIVFSGVKNIKKKLMIYRFNVLDKTHEVIEIDTFFPDVTSYFALFNNTMVIGGREKTKPSIVFYDLGDRKPVILQGFYEKNLDIYDVDIDEKNELFTVLLGYMGKNRRKSLHVKSFDELGIPVEDIRIEPDNDVDLIHAKSIIVNRSIRLIAGIYRERKSSYSTGIFMITLHLDGNRRSAYYPFDMVFQQMDSINRIVLNDNQASYISGMPVDQTKSKWQITDLDEYRSDNLVLLESFTTDRASVTYMNKFENYYYQQAILLLFNDQLSINGIHQLDMTSIMSDDLKKNVRIRYYEDSLKLYLTNQNVLVEKAILPLWESKPMRSIPVDIRDESDSKQEDDQIPVIQLNHWYRDVFLLSVMKPTRDNDIQAILHIQKLLYP
jgi:hypothetical protein